MEIELTKFLNSVSLALDFVEGEFLHQALDSLGGEMDKIPKEYRGKGQMLRVAPNHAKRVAVLSNRMAHASGMDEKSLYALTHAALLHDAALSEYLRDEFTGKSKSPVGADLKSHCIKGEKIAGELPFYDSIQNVVLYHHERPDGYGPFGKRCGEVPFGSELIHLADDLDTRFSLDSMSMEKYETILEFVKSERGRTYSGEASDAFFKAASYELLSSMEKENVRVVLDNLIPSVMVKIPVELLRKMSHIFADITDYKSHFTWRHSLGIAEKAEQMGHYYGYSGDVCDKLYIAGALHDTGKIFISNDILEKPGKLTSSEYKEIQNHAMGTWKLLEGIKGMEDITSWAANHHEKLDGSGYPYGKHKEELSRNDRLMACLDIYQALVEERPYKKGLSHMEAMAILNKMGNEGQLDKDILLDIDDCFKDRDERKTKESSPTDAEILEFDGEVYRCPVCGYIYKGELPDDFICPQCEQPGSIFERIK